MVLNKRYQIITPFLQSSVRVFHSLMAAPGSSTTIHPNDPFAGLADEVKRVRQERVQKAKKEISEKIKKVVLQENNVLDIDLTQYTNQGITDAELKEIQKEIEVIGLKVKAYDGTKYDDQWSGSNVRVYTWKISL